MVMWLQVWQFPLWVLGMTVGALAMRLKRYAGIRPLLQAMWTDPNNYPFPLIGFTGELGPRVAAQYGPAAPAGQEWLFPEWQWLEAELKAMEWLASRYPEWLRRDGEPEASMTELSVLLNIAAGVRQQTVVAWWSLKKDVARRYGERLHRNVGERREAAEALGLSLEAFDEAAPQILASAHGLGMFPDLARVAAAFRSPA